MKEYSAEKVATAIGIEIDSMWMLLGMFTDTIDGALSDIEQAITNMDFAGIHAHSHKLKGSASNLGFNELTEYCQTLESAAKAEENTDYNALFIKLKNEAESIKDWYAHNKQG